MSVNIEINSGDLILPLMAAIILGSLYLCYKAEMDAKVEILQCECQKQKEIE